MKEKKILVLGSTGMLGHMVFSHLSKNKDLKVTGTVREEKYLNENTLLFDAEKFTLSGTGKENLTSYDYLINCIGIIKPYCKDNDPEGVQRAIIINALFPHKLKTVKTKIIQIATDCVYSGNKGDYIETDPHDALDVYGKTKSLGEVFDGSVLNIRCSIIGPEIKGKLSLLEWFLSQKEGSKLKGFAHHLWNGVTTLQFAKLCEKIILNDLYSKLLSVSPTHHFYPNNTVSKYELLNIFSKIFNKKHEIEYVDNFGPPVKRTLSSKFTMLSEILENQTIEEAIKDLFPLI